MPRWSVVDDFNITPRDPGSPAVPFAPLCGGTGTAPTAAQLCVLGHPQIPVLPLAQHPQHPQLWPFLVGPGWSHSSSSPAVSQGHPGGSGGSGAVLQPVVPATGTLSAPVTLLYCSRDKMTNLIILTPVLSPSSSQFTSSPYALMEEQPAFF